MQQTGCSEIVQLKWVTLVSVLTVWLVIRMSLDFNNTQPYQHRAS